MDFFAFVFASSVTSFLYLWQCVHASAIHLGCSGGADFYEKHKPTSLNRMTYNFICHRVKAEKLKICEIILRRMTYLPWSEIAEQFKNTTVPDDCVQRLVKYRRLREEDDEYEDHEFEVAVFECPTLRMEGDRNSIKVHITRGAGNPFNRKKVYVLSEHNNGYCAYLFIAHVDLGVDY